MPSSIGRAATTGRKLWPGTARPPRSEPSRASRGDFGGTSRAATRSSGAPRPSTSRRTSSVGGYEKPSPLRRSLGGPSKPVVRGGRLAKSSAERSSAQGRRELGGDQVEGRQAVRELLAARRRAVHEVWMMEGSDSAAILREIQSLARASHVPVRLVTQRQIQLAQGSEAPQGVIAFAEPLSEADLSTLVGLDFEQATKPVPSSLEEAEATAELPAGAAGTALVDAADPGPARTGQAEVVRRIGQDKMAFLIVVDGVTDPQNLGALLRSAECAGATGIVLPRHRSAHVTPTVTKVAAGAVEHVQIAVVPGVPGALLELERLGVFTIGLDERGPEPLFSLRLGDRPLALVIGAEGKGLAALARQRCDVLARIPLHGSIDSLNVSAAGAVAMFEVARQRSAQGD
ncbi:MAG: 23S rRNA (guanosine(2251)-2'-O)-methyltransferase RlmB [Acidimicrobiales bacterium]